MNQLFQNKIWPDWNQPYDMSIAAPYLKPGVWAGDRQLVTAPSHDQEPREAVERRHVGGDTLPVHIHVVVLVSCKHVPACIQNFKNC
jgi:hypothetical protein